MSTNITLGKDFYLSTSYKGDIISTTNIISDGNSDNSSPAYSINSGQCLYVIFDELYDIDSYSFFIASGGQYYAIDFFDENDYLITTINSPMSGGLINSISVIEKVKGLSIRNTRSSTNQVREIDVYGTVYIKPPLNKTLISSNNEYKRYVPEIPESGLIIGTTSAIPNMTSNTTPSGKVLLSEENANYNGEEAFYVFNSIKETYYSSNSNYSPLLYYIGYEFPNDIVIVKYSIQGGYASSIGNMVNSWDFEGSNNGIDWELLDRQIEQGSKFDLDFKIIEYPIANNKKYKSYRLNITANNGNSRYTRINGLNMFELISEGSDYSPAQWETISSSIPTSQQFLTEGMDSLSPLLDRRLQTLKPLPMTEDSTQMESGKLFGKTIDLKKYIDIRNIGIEVK